MSRLCLILHFGRPRSIRLGLPPRCPEQKRDVSGGGDSQRDPHTKADPETDHRNISPTIAGFPIVAPVGALVFISPVVAVPSFFWWRFCWRGGRGSDRVCRLGFSGGACRWLRHRRKRESLPEGQICRPFAESINMEYKPGCRQDRLRWKTRLGCLGHRQWQTRWTLLLHVSRSPLPRNTRTDSSTQMIDRDME